MKAETTLNKLAALLGIDQSVVEASAPVASDPTVQRRRARKATEERKASLFNGVDEDKIQEFREAQGLIYFLQAPALFTFKMCNRCSEPFYVSRKQVGFCSYTCIKSSLADMGLGWSKGNDLEALVNDPQVYQGNEPIWVRNLPQLKKALEVLCQEIPSSPEPSPESP